MKERKKQINFRLSQDIINRIKLLADVKNQSEAEVIEDAVNSEINWMLENFQGFKFTYEQCFTPRTSLKPPKE